MLPDVANCSDGERGFQILGVGDTGVGWGDSLPPGEHSGGALGAQDPPAPQAELRHGQGSCTAAARRGAAPGRAPPDRTPPGRAPHGRAPLPGPGTAGAAPAPHDAAAAPPGRHSAGRTWIPPPGKWAWGQGKRWMEIGMGMGYGWGQDGDRKLTGWDRMGWGEDGDGNVIVVRWGQDRMEWG